MKVKPAKLCLVLSLLLPAAAFAAGGPPALTLAEAVSRGIGTSPEYGVAARQKNEAQELLSEAGAGDLPELDLQAQEGRQHTVSPLLFPNHQNLWTGQGSLTLTQLLFDGFGTKRLVKSRAYGLQSASYHVDEVGELLGLDIVQAYLDVLRQRDLLEIAR
ncbi:MAG: TolC family protein, partial [Alphaproteobacteria bacterium]|nr:TolC family protein [Alphaproteobacteria bacterium]